MAFFSQIAGEPNPSSSSFPSSVTTMSDESDTCSLDTGAYQPFPLFLLPVEIQLQIYRFAWMTGTVEEQFSRVRPKGSKAVLSAMKNEFIQLELSKKLKEQLSTVRTMGAVCRHMRDVVYEEYFSRTQAVLQSNIILSQVQLADFCSAIAINNDVGVVIEESTFICEHVRHACIVVTDIECTFRRRLFGKGSEDYRLIHTLRWLVSLRDLKTLEVVFELRRDLASRRGSFWREGHPGLESAKLVIKSLPRLEKLMFRLKWGHAFPQEEAISWEEFPWFQELRQTFLENAAVSEEQDAEQRCFKFKNHIGVTYPDWPCSYEI